MDISTIKDKKAFILDLDGTIYLGDTPIKGAINFINSSQYDFFYVTNNTSKSISDYVIKLQIMGITNVNPNQIITPIRPLLTYLKSENMQSVYAVATQSFKDDLRDNGITVINDTNESCDAFVLAYDTELTYSKICDAAELINKDIPYLATHIDINCPSPKGGLPDVGSFVKMFKASTNREPLQFFGKPSKHMIESILDTYSKDEVIFFGDRIYTDGKLAKNCDIDFCLVLSGETTLDDIKDIEKDFFILNELGDLTNS